MQFNKTSMFNASLNLDTTTNAARHIMSELNALEGGQRFRPVERTESLLVVSSLLREERVAALKCTVQAIFSMSLVLHCSYYSLTYS